MTEATLVVVSAIAWTIAATAISQIVSISIMSWLGLPPKKLIHEIEVIQNPAVGASFFIISLAVGFFIGAFTSDGFSANDPTYIEPSFFINTAWIVLALVLGAALTWISFEIAHRVMGVENDETTYRYIQRELIQEQNASLAFFLGGLSIVPFIAVVFQMI
ncbi:MAG: hypothetical protein Phog2KO_11270 [Phototrophicaceae bacterium]